MLSNMTSKLTFERKIETSNFLYSLSISLIIIDVDLASEFRCFKSYEQATLQTSSFDGIFFLALG